MFGENKEHEKTHAHCSQSNFPDQSIDLIYEIRSHGSNQYLLKQIGRIDDDSTNTIGDSYAEIVSLPLVAYIPNDDEYDSGPIVVELDDIIVIASLCSGGPIK